MSEKRGHKQQEIEHADHMIDCISNLPECILHHILSFLPTKEVVKTSILSTRWKNLWASVHNFDFDDTLLYANEVDGRHPPKVASFMNFVEGVLRSRDASKLEKFRLSCRVYYNASQILSWISHAIRHNVRELDLCLFVEDPSVMPQSVFNNESLISLKIEMNCVIELPSHILFPCLKILHLSLVTFPNDESAEKLLSGCPAIEELVLLDCEWSNLKKLEISCSTLKRLTIDDLPYFGSLDDPIGCKIKINANNLTCLDYIGYLSNEIFLTNVPSLVKACICIPISHERQKLVMCRAVDLLKGLQGIISLRVSNRTLESLIYAGSMVNVFPVFPNLSHLDLSTEIGNSTFGALMDMLNVCPTLQSMSLSKVAYSISHMGSWGGSGIGSKLFELKWVIVSTGRNMQGFECCMRLGEHNLNRLSRLMTMSHRLKTVTFKNFNANDSEICFLKCVFKNACVLEKMNIEWCRTQPLDLKKQRDVRRELDMTKKCSTSCIIKFS